jgi:hypothetical protein
MPALPLSWRYSELTSCNYSLKGTVISYVYDAPGVRGEVVDDMPRAYRQHNVPNVHDDVAIEAQVRAERTDVPDGSFVDWTR